MDKSRKFLSDLAFYRTYSATKEDGTKECWDETVDRYQKMLIDKFPQFDNTIEFACALIRQKLVVPSMRALQFSGAPILANNVRLFNCSFLPLSDFKAFAELTYLLMCGVGVGCGVRSHEIKKLNMISEGYKDTPFKIADSKAGWADSILELMYNPQREMDYSLISPAGAAITCGTASGPAPLEKAHEKIRNILRRACGRKLTAEECADIYCFIGEAIVVGGVRRSAGIILFDQEEMLTYKGEKYWKANPQRAMVNVSRVILRDVNCAQALVETIKLTEANNSGEPGCVLLNEQSHGVNPCGESTMRPFTFCNLAEVNYGEITDEDTLSMCVGMAAFLGVLQSTFTNFPYLRDAWRRNTEEDRLLGVSLTGVAKNFTWGEQVPQEALVFMQGVVMETCEKLGLNLPKRITLVKPSGTTSAVLGTSSGIHAPFSEYHLRRVRIDKSSPVATALMAICPVEEGGAGWFLEQDLTNTNNIVVSVPIHLEARVYADTESAVDSLKRIIDIQRYWIHPMHREGADRHNCSATVYYRPEELEEVKAFMVEHKDEYVGISLFPYNDSKLPQLPFEKITKEEYESLMAMYEHYMIDLSQVNYKGIQDERGATSSCSGGACEFI